MLGLLEEHGRLWSRTLSLCTCTSTGLRLDRPLSPAIRKAARLNQQEIPTS